MVDYWFADTISGKTSAAQRPQFAALLNQFRNGETLVVSKLDRLGRDAQDVGATVKLLASRKISVIVLQLGKLDLTSAAGKMMLTMLAAVAEMERGLLVERTQVVLARAKNEGKALGRPSKTMFEQVPTFSPSTLPAIALVFWPVSTKSCCRYPGLYL